MPEKEFLTLESCKGDSAEFTRRFAKLSPTAQLAVIRQLSEKAAKSERPRASRTKVEDPDTVFHGSFPRCIQRVELKDNGHFPEKIDSPLVDTCQNCLKPQQFEEYKLRGSDTYYRCPSCGWMGTLATAKCGCIVIGGKCNRTRHVPTTVQEMGVPRKFYETINICEHKNCIIPPVYDRTGGDSYKVKF